MHLLIWIYIAHKWSNMNTDFIKCVSLDSCLVNSLLNTSQCYQITAMADFGGWFLENQYGNLWRMVAPQRQTSNMAAVCQIFRFPPWSAIDNIVSMSCRVCCGIVKRNDRLSYQMPSILLHHCFLLNDITSLS